MCRKITRGHCDKSYLHCKDRERHFAKDVWRSHRRRVVMGLCRREQRINVFGEGSHALLQHRLLGVVLLGLRLNLGEGSDAPSE